MYLSAGVAPPPDVARRVIGAAGSAFDACVMGAGPAGLAVAMRLAAAGRDVIICDQATGRSRWGGETFAGAIRGPLSELGCWEGFERARHVAGYERQCAWGGEPRAENALFQPQGPLWHVDRDRFDADLRRAAHDRGVVFERYRKLESVRVDGGPWTVALNGGRVVEARYLVDATGRRRVLGRRLGARIQSHDRLVGLTARWPVVRPLPRSAGVGQGHRPRRAPRERR